jgi:excisionase family DNA binding protein
MYEYFENIDEILNLDQFCTLLDVGKSTGYKLLRSGRIKGFKIGKVWKVPSKSVEAFVAAKIKDVG